MLNQINVRAIRQAINHVVKEWMDEGDIDPINELRTDAFHHLRWLMERMSFEDAISHMTK